MKLSTQDPLDSLESLYNLNLKRKIQEADDFLHKSEQINDHDKTNLVKKIQEKTLLFNPDYLDPIKNLIISYCKMSYSKDVEKT